MWLARHGKPMGEIFMNEFQYNKFKSFLPLERQQYFIGRSFQIGV